MEKNREIKFKSYIKENGIITPYIWEPFSSTQDDTVLTDEQELLVYGLQYTGLKDKNGKEIYEGDILELHDRLVKVVWHDYGASFDTDFIKYTIGPDIYFQGLKNANWHIFTEVIGNIYENPELLNDEK